MSKIYLIVSLNENFDSTKENARFLVDLEIRLIDGISFDLEKATKSLELLHSLNAINPAILVYEADRPCCLKIIR